MGKEADPLPRGVRMAVILLRIFSWPLVNGAAGWVLATALLSCLLWVFDFLPFWIVDQIAAETTALFAVGLAMRTFAEGIDYSHRQHKEFTGTARWWRCGCHLALWCRYVAGWLACWYFGYAIAIATGASDRPLRMGLLLLGLHACLFIVVTVVEKRLKESLRKEFDSEVRLPRL